MSGDGLCCLHLFASCPNLLLILHTPSSLFPSLLHPPPAYKQANFRPPTIQRSLKPVLIWPLERKTGICKRLPSDADSSKAYLALHVQEHGCLLSS